MVQLKFLLEQPSVGLGLAHQPLSAQGQPFQIRWVGAAPSGLFPVPSEKRHRNFRGRKQSSLGPHPGERQPMVPEKPPPTRRKSKQS